MSEEKFNELLFRVQDRIKKTDTVMRKVTVKIKIASTTLHQQQNTYARVTD